MAKLITGIVCFHIFMGFLAGIWQGGGGYVVHELTTAVDADDLTLELDTTNNYIANSTVTIGAERIVISTVTDGTHLAVAANGRGIDGTKAVAHPVGSQVYTEESAVVHGMIQYRIARIADSAGPQMFVEIPWQILMIGKDLIVSPFTFFGTDLWFISAIYSALLVGLIVVIGLSVAGGRRI